MEELITCEKWRMRYRKGAWVGEPGCVCVCVCVGGGGGGGGGGGSWVGGGAGVIVSATRSRC